MDKYLLIDYYSTGHKASRRYGNPCLCTDSENAGLWKRMYELSQEAGTQVMRVCGPQA